MSQSILSLVQVQEPETKRIGIVRSVQSFTSMYSDAIEAGTISSRFKT